MFVITSLPIHKWKYATKKKEYWSLFPVILHYFKVIPLLITVVSGHPVKEETLPTFSLLIMPWCWIMVSYSQSTVKKYFQTQYHLLHRSSHKTGPGWQWAFEALISHYVSFIVISCTSSQPTGKEMLLHCSTNMVKILFPPSPPSSFGLNVQSVWYLWWFWIDE